MLDNEIFNILTKKRFSKEKPFLENFLIETIKNYINKNSPIKLVGFWGFGKKDKPNRADEKSCETFRKMNDEVKSIYSPGIEFTFIFSKEHGINNGININLIDSYIKGMKKLFDDFGFKYLELSFLWEKYNISFEKIDTLYLSSKNEYLNNFPNLNDYIESASIRNYKYSPEEGAGKYIIMRLLEKSMLEKEFTDFIFHTYSGYKYSSILPELARLHLFSYKKGRSDSPWFVTE